MESRKGEDEMRVKLFSKLKLWRGTEEVIILVLSSSTSSSFSIKPKTPSPKPHFPKPHFIKASINSSPPPQQQPKPLSVSIPRRPLNENIRDEAHRNNPTYSHLFSTKYIPFNLDPSHQTSDDQCSGARRVFPRSGWHRLGELQSMTACVRR
ncbi:hypothetical protein CMV_010294 [Castanea mollissima]|uniref:Uncharacterized protein n=1 Tax=Castanea mollissima TaxID=60419 RepID=A0A8J4R5N8_9ROSI|nr:hypothetical protein CMV_010294 [Castanea mollissima]